MLFASDRTQTRFQKDIRRKPFSKQVTKNGEKTTEKLHKHHQSKCHKSALPYEAIVLQRQNALEMLNRNKKKHRELN